MHTSASTFPRAFRRCLRSKTPAIMTVTPITDIPTSISPTSTRSQSFSSTGSSNSNTSDLSSTARSIINSLCNDRDFSSAHQSISPDISVQHGDEEQPLVSTRDAYLESWRRKLQAYPDYHMEVKEACVDEKQMKVWVRSEITGLPGGGKKESVDMLTFNDEGVLVGSVDFQRKIRMRDVDE